MGSSVRDYSYENGRRYHAYRQGQYPIPNDEEEQERLALVHHLFRLLIGGGLFRAPFMDGGAGGGTRSTPSRILDIGTGTGIWALDMAEDLPQSEIIGTDLSPIQPSFSPPNCRFFVDDAESDWTFSHDEAFDYIHARSMCGGLGDWRRFLRQAYGHLIPGGWVEAQEYELCIRSEDGTHEQAVMLKDWQRKLDQASRIFGKQMNLASNIPGWMRDTGLVNVSDDIYKVFFSPPLLFVFMGKGKANYKLISALLAHGQKTRG